MSADGGEWIFGYGSLLFRPAFAARRRVPGVISGYVRRFWQGSTDHRGRPGAPGRVVTLVPQPNGQCWGVAYQLSLAEAVAILADLDVREQGGYTRLSIEVALATGERVSAITYYADARNRDYLGEASAHDIAAVARVAIGPSGPNRDYVTKLAASLADIGKDDPHVSEIAALLASDESPPG